jgi:hypothetical protein
MVVPKLLTVIAADEFFAGLVVSHFFLGALKLGNVVEEVQREENHGCEEPLKSEDEEEEYLIPILASYTSQQAFNFIFLCSQHTLVTAHIL